MNVVKAPSDLPPMDSGPLGTPGSLLPSLETKPEPRLMRKLDEAPSPRAADVAARQRAVDAVAVRGGAAGLGADAGGQRCAQARRRRPTAKPATIDSGPVPLPPPPGDELPIDEPSGLVNLSHVSKPSLAHPIGHSKPVVETFGGVAVTPSQPTPAPRRSRSSLLAGGRAGAPGWLKWAALAGAAATVSLLVVVVLLMGRKPTVIVVPPAPTLDDGKKVADQPITVEDPGARASGASHRGDGRRRRRQARAEAPALVGARRHRCPSRRRRTCRARSATWRRSIATTATSMAPPMAAQAADRWARQRQRRCRSRRSWRW